MILVLVLIIGGFVSIQAGGLKERTHNLRKTYAEKQELLEAEKERTNSLEEQRVYVKTKEYIEARAREMGLLYPGEVLFIPSE